MPVSLSALAAYEPRWLGVRELNIGDEWRARWVAEPELPPHAPVFHAYAVVYMGDKGYCTRPAGTEHWGTVEGSLAEKESPAAWVKRAVMEQAGATPKVVELVGFLECKATTHNESFPPGTITVRPIYVVAAKQVKDLPDDSPFERRRLPLNEHMKALRNRYPELEEYMGKAAEIYFVMRANGRA